MVRQALALVWMVIVFNLLRHAVRLRTFAIDKV
jgi:hypothetical protein